MIPAETTPGVLHNRWFQLGASLVAMIMIANFQYGWTLFVNPLQKETGWKLSDIQWAFTVFIFCQTWSQPVQGWLIDRIGPQVFIGVAGVLCGVGWAAMGRAESLFALYAFYAVTGVGSALVYSGCIGTALKWFKDRRGLAAGITAAGFGSGAALFIPAIDYLIRHYGHRTAFLWTGIVQGVVILAIAPLLRHPPAEPVAASPLTGKPAGAAAIAGRHQFTTIEMLRTPRFYLLYAMMTMMGIGGLMVTAQAGPVSGAWGLAPAVLTLATSLSPIANGGSRIFWGYISDHAGRALTMGIAFTLQAACLLLVVLTGHLGPTWFILSLVLVYFTWGEVYSLFPSALTDTYGARHATSNYAVLYTSKGVAAIVGGGLAAKLFEHFGTWSIGFYGCAGLALLSALLAFGIRRGSYPFSTGSPQVVPELATSTDRESSGPGRG